MKSPINIYDLLSPEDAAEHKRLTRLLERARSPQPLTLEEIAELSGCSKSLVRYHQSNALAKIKNKHPELKEFLKH